MLGRCASWIDRCVFTSELKQCGYDGIIFRGKSPEPVGMYITDEGDATTDRYRVEAIMSADPQSTRAAFSALQWMNYYGITKEDGELAWGPGRYCRRP